jgi:AraC-like DNA-binding protein
MLTSLAEVLWTARYDYKPGSRLARHRHDYFQIIYFISGSGVIDIEQSELSINPNSLLLIKPGDMHALRPSSLVKTLDLKFLVKNRPLRSLLLGASDLFEDNDPWVSDLFERIRHEGERGGYLYRELCSAFLSELLIHCLRLDRSSEAIPLNGPASYDVSGDGIVQQAVLFIQKHYADDCDIHEIAEAVGKSDRHIRQHFRDVLNISPRRYLLEYRIQKAKELIEHSSYAFKEIADRVGFKTVHHFARTFHEISGQTPGEWRRRYQAGICKDVYINPHFVNTNWTSPAGTTQVA